MAQRFFKDVLLPRVRNELAEGGKLNVHLYNSIAKSLYKPAAFFKGFLLPLVKEGCTVKEAVVIGSVSIRMHGNELIESSNY